MDKGTRISLSGGLSTISIMSFAFAASDPVAFSAPTPVGLLTIALLCATALVLVRGDELDPAVARPVRADRRDDKNRRR